MGISKVLTCLYCAYFFSCTAVYLCFAVVVTLLTAPFDKNRKFLHLFCSAWSIHYLLLNPLWKTKIEGREFIDPKKTYVIIANHQSFLDILLLYGLFRPYKWVSRHEIFSLPLIGMNMYLNQYVRIARGNLSSIREMMKTCKWWINRGSSIMMFPEGTRTETGEIGPLREGSFKLAIDCNVPLVPVVIDGTFKVFPKRARQINFNTPIRVRVLPPVMGSQFDNDHHAMRAYVYGLMKATLAEMRGQPPCAQSVSGTGSNT